MKKLVFYILLISNVLLAQIPSFPGAEGFGAVASGGRGGQVVYVTSTNARGAGTLDSALNLPFPAYILFKVSGIIGGTSGFNVTRVRSSHKTVAGQTSPGGVIVRGLQWADNYISEMSYPDSVYRQNIIVRHIKSRIADDALRVLMGRTAIIDRCSFIGASDECAQISRINKLTIQNCIFAETDGDHWEYGGMLVNYGDAKYQLDSLSIHHNLFMRLYNRLPECQCNDNADSAWCDGHNFKFEFSNNLYWDPGFPQTFSYRSNYNSNVDFSISVNSINNLYKTRENGIYPNPMYFQEIITSPDAQVFLSGNKMSVFPNNSDYELVWCCNNFYSMGPADRYTNLPAVRLSQRNPYAIITYTETDSLIQYVLNNILSNPTDSTLRRYRRYVGNNLVDSLRRDLSFETYGDYFMLDFDTLNPPATPTDTDNDGMPDSWETANGLNPNVDDHLGKTLSVAYTGVEGYDNLEVYLNALSDSLTTGQSMVISVPDTLLFPGDNINTAVQNAQSGDTIMLSDGSYTSPGWLDGVVFNPPVVIIAQNRQMAVFNAGNGLNINNCSGLVFDGLEITNLSTTSALVQIQGSSNNITIKNCYIHDAPLDADCIKVNQSSNINIISCILRDPGDRQSGGGKQETLDLLDVDTGLIKGNYFTGGTSRQYINAKGQSDYITIESNILMNHNGDQGDAAIILGGWSDGTLMAGDSTYECENVVVKNNIIVNSQTGVFQISNTKNGYIYNNLAINCKGYLDSRGLIYVSPGNGTARSGGSTNINLYNNIFTGDTLSYHLMTISGTTLNSFQHSNNAYYFGGYPISTNGVFNPNVETNAIFTNSGFDTTIASTYGTTLNQIKAMSLSTWTGIDAGNLSAYNTPFPNVYLDITDTLRGTSTNDIGTFNLSGEGQIEIPVINSILPIYAAIGDTLTITGTDLGTSGTVSVNGQSHTPVSRSSTQIKVIVACARGRNLTVSVSNGEESDTETVNILQRMLSLLSITGWR